MTLTPGQRKFTLTAHVIVSVGWIGIVVGFGALAVAGLASSDPRLVRASYVAMDFSYRMVVVPFGLATLISGIISSVSTDWGLFRYYWVLVKLLLTIPAVGLMLMHIRPMETVARVASTTALSGADLVGLRTQLVGYAGAASLVLITATVLSTYKPRGRTRYGIRKLSQRR